MTLEATSRATPSLAHCPWLRHYHRIKDGKRMLVLLPRAQWGEWLGAELPASVVPRMVFAFYGCEHDDVQLHRHLAPATRMPRSLADHPQEG